VSPASDLGLLLAALSAGALNWGFFVQQEAASSLPRISVRAPVRSLRSLFSSRRWLAGFSAGLAGWALYVAALALAPLSLVQATSAGGIGVLALLVARVRGVALERREWLGVGVALAGLAVLGVSLSGGARAAQPATWLPVMFWIGGSLALAGIFAGPFGRALAPGAGLGLAAGVLYATGDVGTKAAVTGGIMLGFVPVLLACHGLGFVSLQLGFQRGGALATAGLATLMTNALPIAAGMLVFRERVPAGALGAARLVAFGAVVAGTVLLARTSGDHVEQASPTPRGAPQLGPPGATAAEPDRVPAPG
jgi:hypothetical protein